MGIASCPRSLDYAKMRSSAYIASFMSLPPHRATDLATAYKISDVQPLTGEDLDRYYVDLGAARKNDAIININCTLELQEPAQHSAILFTGHRGCGKSTELRLLQRQWQQDFQVIYL
jgi:ABC-type transport system involved in cytochrome bd biosynthesis fused ATPase/permease subunit